MTSEKIFGSGSGRSHVGVRVDKLDGDAIVGVMMLDVSPGNAGDLLAFPYILEDVLPKKLR